MDNPTTSKELPPAPSSSEVPTRNQLNHSQTTPPDFDTMESSGRSNGRSSIDSTFDRPKSQPGEAPDTAKAGSSGFSKLLRRKNKKKTQKQSDEQSTMAPENDRYIPGSRDGNSATSSFVKDDQNQPDNEGGNLTMDDLEPDRYSLFPQVRWLEREITMELSG